MRKEMVLYYKQNVYKILKISIIAKYYLEINMIYFNLYDKIK